MSDLPLLSACTWISPAHIIHYFSTEEFSDHPFQTRLPGCFLCYIKSVRILTPVGMLLLPLGDHYRVWQLSLTFSSISCCQTKLQTFNKKYIYQASHTLMAEPRLTAGKNHTGCPTASHVHLLPTWSPPSLSATAPLPACIHMDVIFNRWHHLLKKNCCLATNRPQDCVWFGGGMEAMLMRLTISFQMGCSLHVTNCWCMRLLVPAEESLSTFPCILK